MGRYFELDKRSVNQEGVDRVMKLLAQHYFSKDDGHYDGALSQSATYVKEDDTLRKLMEEISSNSTIMCDEELLDTINSSR